MPVNTLWLSLLSSVALVAVGRGLLSGDSAAAQTVLHKKTMTVLAGRMVENLLRLEPKRRYTFQVSLSGYSVPFEMGRVAVELVDGGQVLASGFVSDAAPVFTTEGLASGDGDLVVRCKGGGELNTLHRITVEWQADLSSRMASAPFVPSPNQSARSNGATVTAVIVHATVIPTLEATTRQFLTRSSQVSAHYVVGRDGAVVQMVEDTARAWHAGVSELEGVKGVNDFSVGIEIVNLNDGRDPFTDAQYEAVAAIIRHLREQYMIPDSRIVSHEFIARPAGRKSDPRGFDFPRLLKLARISS
jgi:N-acetylmuramoyl-L-alanine amidase